MAEAEGKRLQSFAEFWPFYLSEHRSPVNRWLHFTGSSLGVLWLGGAVVTLSPGLVLVGLVNGYAFAWVGHFFFEKNRPATFTYPLWSFVADWKMWWFMLTGRLERELAAHSPSRP